MNEAIQVVIGGLAVGAVYFLLGAGISLVFGQSRIVNFAHGQFLIIAGFTGWALQRSGVPLVVSLIVAVLVVAVIAVLLERLLLRRVVDSPFTAFLVSLGVFLILQQAVISIWGPSPEQLSSPLSGSWQVGQINIPKTTPLLLAVSIVVGTVLVLSMRKTSLGRRIRASAEDSFASEYCGVNVSKISSLTFAAGSAIAGLAGVLVALVYPIDPYAGDSFLIKGFVVALIGGLGSIEGAAVGGIVLGLAETSGQAYGAGEWVPAIGIGLLILVLLVRPNGLFARFGNVIAESAPINKVKAIGPDYPIRKWGMTAMWVIGIAIVPFVGLNSAGFNIVQIALVYAVVACSVGFLYRMTGLLTFGAGAFMGLGGYMCAIAVTSWGWNFWLAFVVALVACGAAGAVVGFVLARTRGLYFLIITFSIADALALIELNTASVTGGSSGVTVTSNFGSIFGISFGSARSLYYLFAGVLLVVMVVIGLTLRSGYGRRSQSIRENERLAMSLGVSPRWYIVTSFAISSMIAGVGGILFLYQDVAISPSLFTGLATVTFPLMVILGGSLEGGGPLVGAAILTLLPHYLNFSPATKAYIYGALIVVMMLSFRDGLVPRVNELVDSLITRVKGSASGGGSSGSAEAKTTTKPGRVSVSSGT